jgi:flavin reductase (DIM6/NTAB) family NADH-FMN oxidoreductase RutF
MDGQATFNALVGDIDYPMFILTAAAGGDAGGCLIGFTTQTSIDPSRFLVCLSRKNRTYRIALRADVLGVHLVPADSADLAALFGGETGDEVDKLARCRWHPGPGGAPILERCTNWFVGRILTRLEVGDHDAFLLEPIAGEARTPSSDFTFHRAKRIEAGHEA